METAFIGRARELAALHGALTDALDGRGSLWLLAGGAGIGKTRLAQELAAAARAAGATARWGICWEGEGAPAFWPWMQVMRAAARGRSDVPLAAERPDVETDAARADTDSPQARFALFDGVATFWQAQAADAPIVLLFDDVHWADEPSIRLLEFVARASRDCRLLIVATVRDVELVPHAPLTRALDGLAREGQRLDVRGMAEEDLARLIETTAGAPVSPRLVRTIHDLTEGNPFFAVEITRLLAAQGQLDQSEPTLVIPPSVRETVRRRLEAVSPECRQLLSTAAVIGREFSLAVVARTLSPAARQPELRVLVDEAVAHQVISPALSSAESYVFAHALIREALYEELGAARAPTHRRVGEAIEALYGAVLEPHLAELAHHFLQAAPVGTAERAVAYALRAAQVARRVLAYEEAALHYRAALRALDVRTHDVGSGAGEPAVSRAGLLIDLAEMLKRGGDTASAHEAALQAAAVARTTDSPETMARAALAIPWQMMPSQVRGDVAALLEEAVGRLPRADSRLRASVLARLAAELYFDHDPQRRLELSQQAVAMARRLADPTALALALNSRHWALWGPDGLTERLSVADEIISLAQAAGDDERVFIGRTWRVADLLEMGDIVAVDREIETCRMMAETLRQPQLRHFVTLLQAMRALLAGRFADGERLAGEALSLGAGTTTSATLLYGTQLSAVRRAQGRLDEIESLVKAVAPNWLHLPGARVTLAFLAAAAGRAAEARAELDRLAARGFAELPRDGNWFNAMEQLVQTCAILADDTHAAPLYELLSPYAERTLVVGAAAVCYGSTAYYLGVLAALLRRWPEATRHFEDAVRVNVLLGARPAVAHTQQAYAEMLLARREPGDVERALELLGCAGDSFEALAMATYGDRVRALLAQARSQQSTVEPSLPARRPDAANVFRRQGEYWDIDYAGTAIRLRDSRGLHFLGHLLRHPGREFHVADLAQIAGTAPPATSESYRRMPAARLAAEQLAVDGGADVSNVPDQRAKATYRARLEQLRGDLDEAERFNDAERASRLRTELDFLTSELATRYQMPGYASQSLPVERIRKAVGNRIRATLTKLGREHPALSRHLHASVKLGTFCSYHPESLPDWFCG